MFNLPENNDIDEISDNSELIYYLIDITHLILCLSISKENKIKIEKLNGDKIILEKFNLQIIF
jgi:hypothetical protein